MKQNIILEKKCFNSDDFSGPKEVNAFISQQCFRATHRPMQQICVSTEQGQTETALGGKIILAPLKCSLIHRLVVSAAMRHFLKQVVNQQPPVIDTA